MTDTKTTHLIPGYVYDVNDFDLEQARNNTLKFDGHRFRILFEIAKGCFGNCEGCSLSAIDRKENTPAMALENVKNTLNFFKPRINANKELVTSVVNYGTGDYFMMEESFLEDLFKITANFFNDLHTIRNVVTVSTSLFLSEEKMLPKIKAMTKYLKPGQFAIDGVVDPQRLSTHYDRYLNNYKSITKHLPFFDCVFNFSQGLNKEHADYVIKFIQEANLLNFDFQYAINNTNDYRVKMEQEEFLSFFNYIYQRVPKELITMSIAQPLETIDDNPIYTDIEKHANEIVIERITVNDKGDIYPLGFGFGDIILDERFNFPSIGNIYTEFDETKAKKIIFNELKNIFMKNKICHSCRFSKQCYSTGYAFYNKFNKDNTKCDNIGIFFFDKERQIQPLEKTNIIKKKEITINHVR
jgi:hypothetical protein